MTAAAQAWDRTASTNPVVWFVDVCLRGAGQVMFQNNPLTGAFFIAGIIYGAVRAGMWEVGLGAVIALVVSTVAAIALDVERTALTTGLYGYNGILVGAALPTFMEPTARMWIYLVIGAAISSVVMMSVAAVLKVWQTPALTFPFVLTTWFLLLAAYSYSHLRGSGLSTPAFPLSPTDAAASVDWSVEFAWDTLWRGVSQVFLIDNAITGILFVIGLACSSRWAAGYAVVGSAVAIGTAVALGATEKDLAEGLFGFSAVLTAIALGCTFYKPTWRSAVYALFGVLFTMAVQGAMDAALAPIGIPTLTGPFVFATWLFLLGKKDLRPVGHHLIRGDIGHGGDDRDADTAAATASGSSQST